MSIVSAVQWVRKGRLAAFPRSEVREEAEAEVAAMMMEEDRKEEASSAAEEEDPVVAKYGLDRYDEEPEALMAGTFYADPLHDDPQLADMDDGSDVEETALLPDDMFVLAATTDAEDELSRLDVHVYEERDRNMWAHHDYLLPAFPLALAFVDRAPGHATGGGFVAVGTFEPGIEIWDLDVIDAVAPAAVLGGPDTSEGAGSRGTGKKKRKQRALLPGSHKDSVLSLSWNKARPEVLASGSADHAVKVWDLTRGGEPVHTFWHHRDKVQAVEWCPTEPAVLLTTSYDHRVCVIDVRTESAQLEWALPADPETAAWIPQAPYRFLVGAEDGAVRCFDAAAAVASGSSERHAMWTIAAHDRAATALAVNQRLPGLIVTGSLDRHVKLWNISGQPSCIYSRDTCSEVFSAAFSEDSELLLALGTSSGVRIWDTAELSAVRRAFAASGASAAAEDASAAAAAAAAAAGDEPHEVMPPGHGPDAERKRAEKQHKEQQEQHHQHAAATPRPPPMARGSRRMRFARPKFSKKKL